MYPQMSKTHTFYNLQFSFFNILQFHLYLQTPKDVSLSKSLSWLLRHGAISEGLKVSEDGFVQLEDVLQHRLFARRCAPADIRRVVNLSKNRFTLRANPVTGIYEIRANSGHTFKDQNNQEGQKTGIKPEVKQNQGRSIPQSGLRSGKNNKNNHKSQKYKIDDLLKNYNIPVGNIASAENHKKRGKTNFYDSLMKYPELKKALLWILRYGSEKEGLTVKRHGYVPVDEILTHPYFKNKCMRQDIITVAQNEPHNFKLRESPTSHQLYVRARKEHPIKQEQEDWSVIPDVIYLPLGFVIHGINGSEWDFVSEHGLKVPRHGYLFCSPYYAADSWHTRGVTKYDDIYIYVNCDAAMQDGIEFFLTPEYSVATKGDKDGFIRTQYFKKVTYCSQMAQTMTTNVIVCEPCECQLHPHAYEQHISGKKHKIKQQEYDKNFKTIFVTGTSRFSPTDLEKIFKKYGEISKVDKHQSKPFAFIQFAEKESVEKALKARVFAGGLRLFVHKYKSRNQPNQNDNKEKARKLSETLSNTSQTEEEAETRPASGVGVKDLPVEIPEADEWDSPSDLVLWQAQKFVSQVELAPEMYQSLYEVQSDMENLFRPLLPGCQVVVFGSCGSTLAFKNSDVDLFLQVPDGEQPKDFVRKEAKELYRTRLFRVITRIPSARVPIVKFEHVKTGWQGDLTANSQLGVCNSQLIRFLVSLDPRIKPLVMVIKYWAKVVGVTGSHARFTTYSLVMLVIFYLQQLDPPLLPSVARLQRMCDRKQISLGWECGFCDDEWRVQSDCLSRPNDLSLRQLLTGFFRFYHTFEYQTNVICPLLGRAIPVKDFEGDDGKELPDEMELYRERLKTDPKCKFKTEVGIKVQDPFELCLNITRNVVERTCSVFKEACRVSLEICEKEEDAALLKSLFSIDEEALSVAEDCVKINIHFREEVKMLAEDLEEFVAQWYLLTVDSIMLVLDKVFKLTVEPYSEKVLKKVKKLESSQDVHTPSGSQECERSVFLCSGKADVWHCRGKMSKFMNSLKIALSPFEREVCISNLLYHPSDAKSFHFSLTISPLKNLKKEGKVIELTVKMKQFGHPLVKGFIQSMKSDFRCFVMKALDFMKRVQKFPPTEPKDSFKESLELRLKNLPDLRAMYLERNEIMRGKRKGENEPKQNLIKFSNASGGSDEGSTDSKDKDEREIKKENAVLQFLNTGGDSDKGSIDNESKTIPGSSDTDMPEQRLGNNDTTNREEICGKNSPLGETSSKNVENEFMKSVLSIDNESKTIPGSSDTDMPEQRLGNNDTTNREEICGKNSPLGGTSSKNVENEFMKSVLSPKNMPSAETQILIDAFFKPSSPSQVTDNIKDGRQHSEVDKFGVLLNAIQKVETQSTFTSDDVNPFLASIEKVALKASTADKETKEIHECDKSASSEAKHEDQSSAEKKIEELNNEYVKTSALSETQNKECLEGGNINENNETKNVEKPQEQENICKESQSQTEVNAKSNEERESNTKMESGETQGLNQGIQSLSYTFPSTSQEKTNEGEVIEEKSEFVDKILNKQVGDTKMYLQRPKIHSERPLKQKKPNANRHQPWVGGGPPGCHQWPRPTQPQASTAQTSHHQNNRGNFEGSRRHYTNRNIQWQKKCYPGLFKDNNV